MEAINHCLLSRRALREYVEANQIGDAVSIPRTAKPLYSEHQKGKERQMPLINVAIVAVDRFSPFHYSVPCILFGDAVSGEKRFNVTICAEKPGVLTSKRVLPLTRRRIFQPSRRRILWWCPTGSTCWIARLRRCSTAWCRQETTARKSSGCVWGRLCWRMRAFSTASARPPTGSLNTTSSRFFARPA